MMTVVLISVVFLAFFNGANDNFKGVATLYGSGTASYRTALAWATLTTGAGAVLSPLIAPGLIGMFKAKGLVPDAIAASPEFMSSAVLAAAATVATATRVGMPVSTTHALTGGLVGAGLVAAGSDLNLGLLAKSYALPLLAGPFVAAILAAGAAVVITWTARRTQIKAADCICIEPEVQVNAGAGLREAATVLPGIGLTTGSSATCSDDAPVRVTVGQALDVVHFLSAGAVSFARGVNDAPKILALALAAGVLGGDHSASVALVALVMAIGGILVSRRVAETMSKRVSIIEPVTGVVANTTGAVLVILGSMFKLPLSTTHVTTGGIVGVGATRRSVEWSVFGKIAAAWLTTLPLGVGFGAVLYLFFSRVV